jgi:hypothetical protein
VSEKSGPVVAGAYIAPGQPAIVCYAKCWPCNLDNHYEQPQWHAWADDEDMEHARETGQGDISGQRCGCYCAVVATPNSNDEGVTA